MTYNTVLNSSTAFIRIMDTTIKDCQSGGQVNCLPHLDFYCNYLCELFSIHCLFNVLQKKLNNCRLLFNNRDCVIHQYIMLIQLLPICCKILELNSFISKSDLAYGLNCLHLSSYSFLKFYSFFFFLSPIRSVYYIIGACCILFMCNFSFKSLLLHIYYFQLETVKFCFKNLRKFCIFRFFLLLLYRVRYSYRQI